MRWKFCALLAAAALAVAAEGSFALAQDDQPGGRERLLVVSGDGKVTAEPDIALITLGVVSEAPAAKDALSANAQSMNRIVSALKESGIESRDLQTAGFSVEPVYSQPPRDADPAKPFTPQIVGYRVSNNLTLRIRDLPRVGALLDQTVKLGANSISGPSFTVDDPTPLEDKARRAATEDAVRKSTLYADAAGVKLGSIFRIEENGGVEPPQPMAAGTMMRMEAAAPTPIEGGELTFEAQVTVSWLLANP